MLSCAAGYYCDFSNPQGHPCPAGRFAASFQLHSRNCSGPCAAGAFCPPGSTRSAPAPCPAGQLCPQGAGAPQPCPAGFYCVAGSGDAPLLDPVTGLVAAVGPTGFCAAGFFCPENSTAPSGAAALDFLVDASGAPAVRTIGPINYCPPGTTNAFPGATSVTGCAPCPTGTYSPGLGSNLPVCPGQCMAGKYGIAVGQSAEARACAECPAGRFSATAGSQYCSPCQIGSFAAAAGSSLCTPCAQGFYGDISGSSNATSCKPCPKGTFSASSGQSLSGCVLCPLGTYGASVGATSSAACVACPAGTFTAAPGATDASACALLSFPCPPGTEPSAPPFALGLSDCVPLACPPPLVPGNASAGCTGCPVGQQGDLAGGRACAPCSAAAASTAAAAWCPGLTSRPLVAPAALPPACVDALLQRSAVRTPDAAVPAALAVLSGGFSSAAFAYASAAFAALLVVSGALALCQRALALRLALALDAFGLLNHVEDGASPVMARSLPGGAVTAAALATVSLIALYYILSAFSLDNVTVVSSLAVLHEGVLESLAAGGGVAWLEAPPSSEAPGGFSGLQVRVLAMGEPGRCAAPLNWSSRGGLVSGAWALEAPGAPLPPPAAAAAGCPAGAEAYSAIVFSCANCTFNSATGVDLVLHYSCQALHLGVAAAGPADGPSMNLAKRGAVVYTRFAPPSALVAAPAASRTLLQSAQLSVVTLFAVVNDTRAPLLGPLLDVPVDDLSGAGYQLGVSSASAVFSNLDSLLGPGGAGFFPRVNGVQLGVQMTQAGFFSTGRVQRAISGMQLVSQITSLLGLLGVFGTLLGFGRRVAGMCGGGGGRRGAGKRLGAWGQQPLTLGVGAPPLSGGDPPAPPPRFEVGNPMHHQGARGERAAAAAPGLPSAAPGAPRAPPLVAGGGAAHQRELEAVAQQVRVAEAAAKAHWAAALRWAEAARAVAQREEEAAAAAAATVLAAADAAAEKRLRRPPPRAAPPAQEAAKRVREGGAAPSAPRKAAPVAVAPFGALRKAAPVVAASLPAAVRGAAAEAEVSAQTEAAAEAEVSVQTEAAAEAEVSVQPEAGAEVQVEAEAEAEAGVPGAPPQPAAETLAAAAPPPTPVAAADPPPADAAALVVGSASPTAAGRYLSAALAGRPAAAPGALVPAHPAVLQYLARVGEGGEGVPHGQAPPSLSAGEEGEGAARFSAPQSPSRPFSGGITVHLPRMVSMHLPRAGGAT